MISAGAETADAEAEGALRRRGGGFPVASSTRRHSGEDELQGAAGKKYNAFETLFKTPHLLALFDCANILNTRHCCQEYPRIMVKTFKA